MSLVFSRDVFVFDVSRGFFQPSAEERCNTVIALTGQSLDLLGFETPTISEIRVCHHGDVTSQYTSFEYDDAGNITET